MEDVDVESFDKQTNSVSASSKKETKGNGGENDEMSDEGLVFTVNESKNR